MAERIADNDPRLKIGTKKNRLRLFAGDHAYRVGVELLRLVGNPNDDVQTILAELRDLRKEKHGAHMILTRKRFDPGNPWHGRTEYMIMEAGTHEPDRKVEWRPAVRWFADELEIALRRTEDRDVPETVGNGKRPDDWLSTAARAVQLGSTHVEAATRRRS